MTIREQMESLKKTLDVRLLEEALDISLFREMGAEDICQCPLPSHDGVDSNPSFSINRDKLVYNCFACGVGGNVIDLVARILDVDYDQAYRFCQTYSTANLSLDETFGQRIENIFASASNALRYTPLPRFNVSILNDWIDQPTDYFEKRGINDNTRKRFSLGYDAHHTRGDYTGPAAIIPHFFEGDLVGYQERWIEEDRPKKIPKYTNSKGFPKAETLFAYDLAVGNNTKPVVVVESALTAIYLDQLGLPAVATFGASISDEQIRLLRSFSWGVTLSFDNDPAGRGACDTICDRLRKTIPIHVIELEGEEKQDLNDRQVDEVETLIENAKPWFMKGL